MSKAFDNVIKLNGLLANVREFGAVGDGINNDATAIQSAISAAEIIYFPKGTYRIENTITVNSAVVLIGETESVILPALGSLGGAVLNIANHDFVARGLTFDGSNQQSVTAIANTYIIKLAGSAPYTANISIEKCVFKNCNAVGGPDITSNLLVTHCVYLDGANVVDITQNTFENISGAAVFLKNINLLKQFKNVMKDIQWYNTNLDYNVSGFISDDFYNCTLNTGVYWGGAINTVNNQGEAKNKNITIQNCVFAGKYSYGAVIRMQSDNGITIKNNTFLKCEIGSLDASTSLTAIRVTTRNPDGLTPSDPPQNILISQNRALEGFGSGSFRAFIYVDNDHGSSGRNPINNINIQDNSCFSPSVSDFFHFAVLIHGRNAGAENVKVLNNTGELYISLNTPVGGGIGVVGTDSDGKVVNVEIGGNSIENKTAPSTSTHVCLQIGQNVDLVRNVYPNYLIGGFYGVRTLSGAGPVLENLDDQYFNSNTSNILFSTALSRYGKPLFGSVAGSSTIATGTTTTQDITVTHAAVGDNVEISFFPEIAGLFIASSKVRAANTVQVLYTNTTGGSIDASGSVLTAQVNRKSST